MIRAVALVLLIPLVPIVFVVGTTSFPIVLLSKFVIGANKRWKESKLEMKGGH